VLWVSWYGIRDDGIGDVYECTIFRNESDRLSSEIITEAVRKTCEEWGKKPFVTYVDAKKVKSPNPGFCFKKANWKKIGMSKSGKILLKLENN